MAVDINRITERRAQTTAFGRDALKQLRTLRQSTGRNKVPRRINTTERSSRSRKSRRRSGKVEKNKELLYQQVTNPRNWYHQDTVQTLMRQLSELNEFNTNKTTKAAEDREMITDKPRMFQLEDSVKNTHQSVNVYGHGLKTGTRSKPTFKRDNSKPGHVIELIEKQMLRDITRHLLKRRTKELEKESDQEKRDKPFEKNTHEEESSGGMKIVITKTTKQENRSSTHFPATRTSLPPFKQINGQNGKLLKPGRIKENKITLPMIRDEAIALSAPAKVGLRKTQNEEAENIAKETYQRMKTKRKSVHENLPNLPKIQEESNSIAEELVTHGRAIALNSDRQFESMMDKATNTEEYNPLYDMISPPTVNSETTNKVKLPILGKSIGKERISFSEMGGKKSYIREIRRIIHGLYGEYFEPSLEGNFTYESQVARQYEFDKTKGIHYVTPTLGQRDEKAGSYTLQLYQSAHNKQDDSPTNKTNRLSIPVLRTKYGKALATSNKTANRREVESQTVGDFAQLHGENKHIHTPGTLELPLNNERNIYKVIQEEYLPRLTPNTPESATRNPENFDLQEQMAHQVMLYREQVARENKYINTVQSGINHYGMTPHQLKALPDDAYANGMMSYDGVDIDLYLEIKHRKSLERRMRLRELKQKQKNRQSSTLKPIQSDNHLEVVEQRDKFLSQINRNSPAKKSPQGKVKKEQNMQFEYYHGEQVAQTPIAKIRPRTKEEKPAQERHAMDTKMYRIFAELKDSQKHNEIKENATYESSAPKKEIKVKLPPTKIDGNKGQINNKNKIIAKRITVTKPPITDLVSRFQIATKYKLDREYVKTLASGTT